MEKGADEIRRYVFWGIIIGILILSFMILKNLFIVIISSVVLAFALKPLHIKLSEKINQKVSAFIIIASIVFLLGISLILFITMFIKQMLNFLTPSNISFFISKLNEIVGSEIMERYTSDLINFMTKEVLGFFYPMLYQIPSIIIGMFIIFFTTYYLLINWEHLEEKVMKIIPFENKEKIAKEIKHKTREIINGTFLIVFIQLLFSAIVLKLLGVGPYIILAIAIGILAFIPGIGPIFVWAPLSIAYFIIGDYFTAIGIFIMGLILSNIFDSLLRAKLLGSRTGTHPVVMLFGILGGIKIFGFIGLVIGP
jgi:predicted PurR-regulated permease PerM